MCSGGALRARLVTSVLLHYGKFLQRAQGDMALAAVVLRRAIEVNGIITCWHITLIIMMYHYVIIIVVTAVKNQISPDDGIALGSYAHFLCEEADDSDRTRLEEAEKVFSRALKADPSNAAHLLWYAKLLKRLKKVPQVLNEVSPQTSFFLMALLGGRYV